MHRLKRFFAVSAAFATTMIASFSAHADPSVAQCDSCGLVPAQFNAQVAGYYSTSRGSTTGPYINLTSAGAASVNGSLNGEVWPGPGASDRAQVEVDATHSLGYLQASSDSSAPTQPDPNLLNVRFNYTASSSAFANGSLTYQLYVQGTASAAPSVGVLIDANGAVSGSASLDETEQVLQASFDLRGPGATIYDSVDIAYGYDDNASSMSGPGSFIVGNSSVSGLSGGFNDDNVYILQTNKLYTITLIVTANNTVSTTSEGEVTDGGGETSFIGGGSVTDTAFIDPSYQIAPGTPDADQYTIYLSSGVSNTVPEPSTWSMMLIGFAGLGFAGWRAKGQSAGFRRRLTSGKRAAPKPPSRPEKSPARARARRRGNEPRWAGTEKAHF
jgi:hypothetical protein